MLIVLKLTFSAKNDRYFLLWFYCNFHLRSYLHFLYDKINDVQFERKQEGKKSPIISYGKSALSYRNEALPLNYNKSKINPKYLIS